MMNSSQSADRVQTLSHIGGGLQAFPELSIILWVRDVCFGICARMHIMSGSRSSNLQTNKNIFVGISLLKSHYASWSFIGNKVS